VTDDVSAEGGEIDAAEQRHAVRERYSDIATEGSSSSCCDGDVDAAGDTGGSTACCGDTAPESMTPEDESRRLGYDGDDIDAVASGANLGLGCGNPTAIASLEPGETVLDLGSGGGFDCFLAAREVGPDGRVIGVDMTPRWSSGLARTSRRTTPTPSSSASARSSTSRSPTNPSTRSSRTA